MATWSRKTYQMVADILHEAYKDRDMVNIWDLMQRFGVEFKMDNPNFDEARFRKACIGGVDYILALKQLEANIAKAIGGK